MTNLIDKGETLWLTYLKDGQPTHLITSDKFRDNYYLYTVKNGKVKKTARKASEPTALYKYCEKGE